MSEELKPVQWKVDIHSLLRELYKGNPESQNGQTIGLGYGTQMASELLVHVGNRAIELNDSKLLELCQRLGLISPINSAKGKTK